MSWKRQPDQSGVYNIRVYNQNARYWRYIADGEYWIRLESYQDDDSFKWKLDQVSGGWHITPFKNASIGFRASPKRRPNGDGMYWFHGFAQGRRGASAKWKIKASSNWSTISIDGDGDVLDSRMEGRGNKDARGCVHFYPPDNFDTTNQHWVFRRVDEDDDDNADDGNNDDDDDDDADDGNNDDDDDADDGNNDDDDDNADDGNNDDDDNNNTDNIDDDDDNDINVTDDDNNGDDNGDNDDDDNGRGKKKGPGKTFEDLWFTLTPQEAAKQQYDIIVVGTGMGAGVVAGDLFDTNSKLGDKAKSILVIEKGGVPFHSHCLNAARPGGFGEDRGQQNDTFFSLFKKNYKFKSTKQAQQWKAGEMFNLGGRGAAWGLFSPRIHDETLEKEFGTTLRQELVGDWYRKAETLMGLFNPTTSSYHASLMERLNMVSERGCQWQWGRIASEFREEKNFDFAMGAYSPIDKLLEIAMSKDRDEKTGKSIEHPNFKILINSDVRSLELDDNIDEFYSGVWVRDLNGKDTLIKLKKNGKIILGAGSVGSPTILMRTSQGMATFLKNNGGLHLTDHDIFAATATFGYLDMSIQEKVGAMKLQTYVKMKSKRIALLNVAVGASSFLPRSSYPPQQRFTNTEYPKMIAAFIFPEPLVEANTIELDSDPRNKTTRRNTEATVSAGRRQPFNSTPKDRGDISDLRELTKKVFKTMQEELKLCDLCVVGPEGAQIEVTDDKFFKALELGGVAHELGTIPLQRGEDDSSYCLDQDLKLRETQNVYVCDLSLFPFSPEVNPTLTLVALAIRLSRHIHDPKVINTKGDDGIRSTMTVAQAQIRRWVINQTGDPIKVYISNISGVKVNQQFVNGKTEKVPATGETILEPGGILEVDRDNKTDETVRVYKLLFGIDWKNWKVKKVPDNPFTTRPLQYVASPQKVCAIE